MNETVRLLLSAAMHAAPTGVEQQAFSKMVEDMYADNLSNLEVARDLSGAIFDGLSCGNWPKLEGNTHAWIKRNGR